ncbi:AAA family ATPase [Acinetobacter tibetensis]|uniref:ATP-binding protein n=1 Tax=Acinetobacter tibetensis TaxID=2943497 RepID=A0AAE9LQB4_9GAMM|nr:ATP-binding protein [Acinetobacter tibetensis]USE82692.1 ATP-binding protein [Acinetobacter tibetensis]
MSNISDHKILSMKVENLKNLKGLEIDFLGNNVTAILGPNGNGKSTILHALACAYSSLDNGKGEEYKFSDFFLPNTDALWNNSSLTINYSFKDRQQEHVINRSYQKNADRWSPRYVNRHKREIYYIGIDKCVPMIESEKKQSRVNYSTSSVNTSDIENVLTKASYVLNKTYTRYNTHKSSSKEFIGVEVGGLKYSALSMSAGEQKVFHILKTIYEASKYSLILIDELDLLLHDLALQKLIEVIVERANLKKIQVIFTTHRESIVERTDINIRHIYSSTDKTFCLNETKPDAVTRLIGGPIRSVNIFVEDDLSRAIVNHVASKLKLKRHIQVDRFGAALNCFTIASGMFLNDNNLRDYYFVLDGDVYVSDDEKRDEIRKKLVGDDPLMDELQMKTFNSIFQYNLPEKTSPEKFMYLTLLNDSFDEYQLDQDDQEIIYLVRQLPLPSENHGFINDLIEQLGDSREAGLTKIIRLLSKTSAWDNYIKPINDFLLPYTATLLEPTTQVA